MDFDGFDQTQAIALDDFSDDTDDLGDPDDKQPAGYLKVYCQKSFKETSFPVYEGDNFIGRHESNQICIPLKALSKKHACIEIQGDSHLIYDMESRNKTRRGKLFLKPSVRYALQDPDSLLFGDVRCQYSRAQLLKKPRETELASDDDGGSDTGSESMLIDAPMAGGQADGVKEPDFGSSSSCDVIQPTQPYQKAEVKKTIIPETPQREDATLVFAESSDENIPAESVKAMADSSISPGSVAETPTVKPLAESTVINESVVEEPGPSRSFELDASALAVAPTQPYGHLAELETQAYPVNTDSDQDDEEGARGASLFDAPTQAFSVPDSDDDLRQDGGPQGSKRISLQPTLLLNMSTDDEKSPARRPVRPPHGSIIEEDDVPILDFPDLATQAYCADTDDQSDGDERSDPTQCPATGPDQAEAETLAYCAETESDADDERGGAAEPTLKYNVGMVDGDEETGVAPEGVALPLTYGRGADGDNGGSEVKRDVQEPLEPTLAYSMDEDDEEEVDISAVAGAATQAVGVALTLTYGRGADGDNGGSEVKRDVQEPLEPTLAYSMDEDDEEEVDISAVAGAATQAYTTAESDSDDKHFPPRAQGSKLPINDQRPLISSDLVAAALATDGDRDGGVVPVAPASPVDEPSSEVGTHAEEATLAYQDGEDEAMETEVSTEEEGGGESMLGYEEMETQPAGQTEETDLACQMEARSLQGTTLEDTDDTTAATQVYGMDDVAADPTRQVEARSLQGTPLEDTDDTTAATQAYGMDDDDSDETPDVVNQPASTSHRLEVADDRDEFGGADQGKVGTTEGEVRGGRQTKTEPEEMDDFVVATQVYGADDGSETQVPDSQEGSGVGEEPLAGILSIPSMLRRVPARSAMASPEKKQPLRGHRVAFKDQVPEVVDDIAPPTRRSARSRKIPAKLQDAPGRVVTETDAKPTRRRSLRPSSADEEDSEAPKVEKALKDKRKGSQDPVEGQGKAVKGTSSEDALELKEGDDMIWKTVEGIEVNNNNNEVGIKGKPPARRTFRRQASYKKAVEGHDSDDTESMSSTSSFQVEVPELVGASVKAQVTVCDGKPSDDGVKPRRGKRNATIQEETPKVGRRTSTKTRKPDAEVVGPSVDDNAPAAASSGRRQSRRSAATSHDATETAPKLRAGRDRSVRQCDDVSEKEQGSLENVRSSKPTKSSRSKSTAAEKHETATTKEAPASARRGRKPKSVPAPQTAGPKQSSIRDFATVQDKDRPDESNDKHSQQSGSLESMESPSLLSPEAAPFKTSAKTRRAKPMPAEIEARLQTVPAAKQDTFVVPEPMKRGGGRGRRKAEKDEAQQSEQPPLEAQQQATDSPMNTDNLGEGKGRKRGRKPSTQETPQKQQQPSPAARPSTSSRRGKRAAPAPAPPTPSPPTPSLPTPSLPTPSLPTPSLPTPSPAKKPKGPETTPPGMAAAAATTPSLRKRASDVKPKVMFTGIFNTAWEKTITSLGGELAGSVFDCTHLVTDKVRRTVKFLCCLARGTPIVSPKWLDQCQLNKVFINPSPYLLQDKGAEKQYGFSLVTSHQRALQGGVLATLSVFVTPNVKPEPLQLKEVILSAGGKYLNRMPRKADPSTVVVACEADEARCRPAIQAGLQVVSSEFLLTGILRQEARPDLYQLFTPTSTAGDQGPIS